LGERYEAEDEAWRKRIATVLWLTYRCGFAEMEPFGYTDDAGWGCCLRSSQMLMAEALSRHLGPRRRHDVVRWFFDGPGAEHAYSIHNMVRCGTRYDMMPGEWYGPGVAAHVLRDLCEMHDAAGDLKLAMAVTSPERPLSEAQVLDAMTSSSSAAEEEEEEEEEDDSEEDVVEEEEKGVETYDPLLRPPPAHRRAAARAAKRAAQRSQRLAGPWQRSLLVVVPLRLGLHRLEDKYAKPLLACLAFPQSVGFVGGRPRQALYFLGATDAHFVGLDPHVVQPCHADNYLESLVCVSPRKVPVDGIDPSLALGFYCRDRADFLDFLKRVQNDLPTLSQPPLFGLEDLGRGRRPAGAASSWEHDDDDDDALDGGGGGGDDDDSEYVVV